MNYQEIKLELFNIRKAFFQYKNGFKYLYNKYFFAKTILKRKNILEKSINNNDLSIHVLTGHKDLIMLIWSLESFYKANNIIGKLYIHSDGSLIGKDKRILNKFFSRNTIVESDKFLEKHKRELEKYPVIKKFRTKYSQFFLLKKLIDPYFVSNKKYHLIIDSDLFWLKQPKELEQEIKNQCKNSLMMVNSSACCAFFKNSFKLDDELANYNSGIALYKKENFNLNKLTDYLKKIDINNPRNNHFIEQAGYAVCLENLKKLSSKYYIIKEKLSKNTIVKHYTGPRRPLFFIEVIK